MISRGASFASASSVGGVGSGEEVSARLILALALRLGVGVWLDVPVNA